MGTSIPILFAVVWLGTIWIRYRGIGELDQLFIFLRGAAPSPNFSKLFGKGGGSYWIEQLSRTWNELSGYGVIGTLLLVSGGFSLLLQPPRKSLPWFLLCLPYLLYETAVGVTLDVGIYSVFIAPALAAGIGLGTADWSSEKKSITGTVRLGIVGIGLLGALAGLPANRRAAAERKLFPWYSRYGATMALCTWVREHTPQDTLVFQPVAWDPAMMATSLYSDRIQLFDDGVIFNPEPWKPHAPQRVFKRVLPVTTADFERWIEEERPLICFDRHPFTSWG